MQQTSSSILLSCNIFHISSAFYWARKHWATPNGVNRFDFSIFSSLPLDWMTWLGWLSVLIFFFLVAKYELHKNNTFKLFIFIPLFFLVKLEGYFFFPNVDLKQRNWWKHHARNAREAPCTELFHWETSGNEGDYSTRSEMSP